MTHVKSDIRFEGLKNPRDVQIMGIVNVTPDSFSDGGRFFDSERAIEHGLRLAEEGADILDVGGESSRPGAEPVSLEEEIKRVIPVIEALSVKVEIPISIDTYKSAVAREALSAGASIINDISAMTFDPAMVDVAAESGCKIILMHIQGTPGNMQKNPVYDNVIGEIAGYLEERTDCARRAGIANENIWVDPGIGFGKRIKEGFKDNLKILRNLNRFTGIGDKLVVGTSRKAFVGVELGGKSAEERLFGSLGTFAWSALTGADILRVHDVKATAEMLKLMGAIYVQPAEGE
ncbi:MAG TPA: dihydropteroate synthase [candidate division Zixibacteria bacterium]|nr:dihydropteroate synthase [candidate division Zixibacteria bacterium]